MSCSEPPAAAKPIMVIEALLISTGNKGRATHNDLPSRKEQNEILLSSMGRMGLVQRPRPLGTILLPAPSYRELPQFPFCVRLPKHCFLLAALKKAPSRRSHLLGGARESGRAGCSHPKKVFRGSPKKGWFESPRNTHRGRNFPYGQWIYSLPWHGTC